MLTLASVTSDHITEVHREAYLELLSDLEPQLCPEGALEILAAAEIMNANWRLRCLRGVEGDIADQTRRAARRGIRQDTAELRRLQFDRRLKAELGLDLPVLISAKDYLAWTKSKKDPKTSNLQNEPNSPDENTPAPAKAPDPVAVAEVEALVRKAFTKEEQRSQAPSPEKPAASLISRNRSQLPGRNTPCPCQSGQKFKRCCGSGQPKPLDSSPHLVA